MRVATMTNDDRRVWTEDESALGVGVALLEPEGPWGGAAWSAAPSTGAVAIPVAIDDDDEDVDDEDYLLDDDEDDEGYEDEDEFDDDDAIDDDDDSDSLDGDDDLDDDDL